MTHKGVPAMTDLLTQDDTSESVDNHPVEANTTLSDRFRYLVSLIPTQARLKRLPDESVVVSDTEMNW